jgi:hypothetical protein
MRVRTIIFGWVEMNKQAMQRLAKCEREGLCPACLQKIEEGEVLVRGCHSKCAKATYRAIAEGKLTDEGQVACGEWKPRSGGRRPSNPVSVKANLGVA